MVRNFVQDSDDEGSIGESPIKLMYQTELASAESNSSDPTSKNEAPLNSFSLQTNSDEGSIQEDRSLDTELPQSALPNQDAAAVQTDTALLREPSPDVLSANNQLLNVYLPPTGSPTNSKMKRRKTTMEHVRDETENASRRKARKISDDSDLKSVVVKDDLLSDPFPWLDKSKRRSSRVSSGKQRKVKSDPVDPAVVAGELHAVSSQKNGVSSSMISEALQDALSNLQNLQSNSDEVLGIVCPQEENERRNHPKSCDMATSKTLEAEPKHNVTDDITAEPAEEIQRFEKELAANHDILGSEGRDTGNMSVEFTERPKTITLYPKENSKSRRKRNQAKATDLPSEPSSKDDIQTSQGDTGVTRLSQEARDVLADITSNSASKRKIKRRKTTGDLASSRTSSTIDYDENGTKEKDLDTLGEVTAEKRPRPVRKKRGRTEKAKTEANSDAGAAEAIPEPNQDGTESSIGKIGKKREKKPPRKSSRPNEAAVEANTEQMETNYEMDTGIASTKSLTENEAETSSSLRPTDIVYVEEDNRANDDEDTKHDVQRAEAEPLGEESSTTVVLAGSSDGSIEKAYSSAEGILAESKESLQKAMGTPREVPGRKDVEKHSPLTNGRVPYRVGLSKRQRIAPLLSKIRK